MTRSFLVALAHLVVLFSLVGCDESYEDQVEELDDFVSSKPLGRGSDYWLVKGSFGVEDRVALVFGYMDDAAACAEIAEMLNSTYPEARYSCRPANL
ncbi:MAG: hypothetical protein ABJL17_07070 [Parvibaculum sp.]|uniref:hypothetical protein n=1 Tax=Parvibaculum sp. TaxID=2024848 RepID=UPI003265FFD7